MRPSNASWAIGMSWSKAGRTRTSPGCMTPPSRSRWATTWRTRWKAAHNCSPVGPAPRIPNSLRPTRRFCRRPPRPWPTSHCLQPTVSPPPKQLISSACMRPIRYETACPNRIRSGSAWNVRSPASPHGTSSSHVRKAPTTAKTAKSCRAISRPLWPAWSVRPPKGSTSCICRRSSPSV